MQGVFSKEHEGAGIYQVNNGVGGSSVSTTTVAPWWGGIGIGIGLHSSGTNNNYMEHYGHQLKSANYIMGQTAATTASQQAGGLENATAQFTVFSDHGKISTKGMHGTNIGSQGHFELGFGQPLVCAKYQYEKQCYGLYSTYGPQLEGRIMLPLNLTNDEGPIFVNAKQYHGIMRRRQSRAKAELKNQMIKRRKPFMHLSRHLHALRRPRGCGGRFLNTKNPDGVKDTAGKKKIEERKILQPTGSQNSEVVQSDDGNMNSPPNNKTNSNHNNMLTNSGSSEMTSSIFSREDLNFFPIDNNNDNNHTLWSLSPQPLPNMMNAGHGIVLPSKWVAGADSCCNLKV